MTFGRHSSHFIPAKPSLHEQTPLSFPHSKVLEPWGLHLQSENKRKRLTWLKPIVETYLDKMENWNDGACNHHILSLWRFLCRSKHHWFFHIPKLLIPQDYIYTLKKKKSWLLKETCIIHIDKPSIVESVVVVGLIGPAVVGLVGTRVVWSVEQSLSAKTFGMGIATKLERPILKVVSDFVHLQVLIVPEQWNL